MSNKWLFIAGVACLVVPLVLFLALYSGHDPYRFVLLVWIIPFAFVGALLLVLAAIRFAAMAIGLSSVAANLTAGAIAVGQWFVARIAGMRPSEQLISDTIAAGGLILVLGCLVVWWRSQGLRQ